MLADVLDKLRVLPYADMMELAKAIEGEFLSTGRPNTTQIAGALAKVASKHVPQSELSTADHKLLLDIFSRRRSISVKSGNGAFELEVQTLHARVLHTDVRAGLSQIIDTVAAARALKGG